MDASSTASRPYLKTENEKKEHPHFNSRNKRYYGM
jgi:hypothetical protein